MSTEILCICGSKYCDIPFGCCHCGCGKKTTIWAQNHTKLGGVKGQPRLYVDRHQYKARMIVAQPFKIDGVYCRLIPLSQSLHTIVWESDYEWLMQWKWSASYYGNTDSFYVLRKDGGRSNGKTISMHRFILGVASLRTSIGDHKNGNSLDNRRDNLRPSTKDESSQNRGTFKNNTSGFKGVYFHKQHNKYAAQLKANRKTYNLGLRDTPEEAYALYCEAAEKYHGEFKNLK